MGRGKSAERSSQRKESFLQNWSATAIFSGLMLALTGAFILVAPLLEGGAKFKADWLAVAFLISGLFAANVARSYQVWSALAEEMQTPVGQAQDAKKSAVSRGLREPLLYTVLTLLTIMLLGLFGGSDSVRIVRDVDFSTQDGTSSFSPAQLAVALLTLALAFGPFTYFIYRHARLELSLWFSATRENVSAPKGQAPQPKLLRDDSVSVTTFYVGTILTLLLVALAIWAAKVSIQAAANPDITAPISEHLAVIITFAVVLTFIAFILLPHIQRVVENWGDDTVIKRIAAGGVPFGMKTPPVIASRIDSVLVRLVAPLTGATQPGRGVPHLGVIFTLVPLTALGFVLPPPFGLAPIALGMLMVIALGRRWAWVEDDRETASRLLQTKSREIHVGFANDLKDEALLGYASLFILVPLALYQINVIIPAFQGKAGAAIDNAFFAWLGFFGAELAKAVPFVDWWEIYDVKIDVPIEGVCNSEPAKCAKNPNSRGLLEASQHLTFAARAMVDLVIMAALLQAIGIWQRGRTQQRLYETGQLDVFDPFMETAFFCRGMKRVDGKWVPTKKFEQHVQDHMAQRSILRLPITPYNETRLTELLQHTDDEVQAGVNWMIEKYNILVGPPAVKLRQLARQWNSVATVTDPHGMSTEHASIEPEWRREQKPRLEAVLDEILGHDRYTQPKQLSDQDTVNLMQLTKRFGAHPEFHYAHFQVIEILAQASEKSPKAFWALVAHACPPRSRFKEWTSQVGAQIGNAVEDSNGNYVPPYFGRQEDRAVCYQAMQELATAYEDDHPMLRRMKAFLNVMRKVEAQTHARPAAQAAYGSIRADLGHDAEQEGGLETLTDIDETEPVG